MKALERLRAAGVTRLCIDSREASKQTAFVALPPAQNGSQDGRYYAKVALAAGAPLVLGEGEAPPEVAPEQWLRVDELRFNYPALAAELAGNPGDSLEVIGITGTDGKTSVAWIASELFNLLEPGKTARLGTLGAQWLDVDERPGFTTLPAALLHPLLERMLAAGQRRVIMEVSSHALSLGRVEGLSFNAAVLTTLSRDHLDFHGDLEAYHNTKLDWLAGFGSATTLVLPESLAARCGGAAKRLTIGSQGLELSLGERQNGWMHFALSFEGERHEGRCQLIGALMLENLGFAIALAMQAGFELQDIVAAAAQVSAVPGRFEPVGTRCLVDYAHTPDALSSALQSLRSQTRGRLIVVFGAGGDRDRGKRAQMAAAVEAHADIAIVTSDNPRNEDPSQIIGEVIMGFQAKRSDISEITQQDRGWTSLVDRRAALTLAWELSTESDLVLVAGKGAESHQAIGAENLPFDDRVELRSLIEASSC
jgi:UDP-N-acetylmuramoyl-L-alanyl-D-glutamate--2,6-diaminopimelate ligase